MRRVAGLFIGLGLSLGAAPACAQAWDASGYESGASYETYSRSVDSQSYGYEDRYGPPAGHQLYGDGSQAYANGAGAPVPQASGRAAPTTPAPAPPRPVPQASGPGAPNTTPPHPVPQASGQGAPTNQGYGPPGPAPQAYGPAPQNAGPAYGGEGYGYASGYGAPVLAWPMADGSWYMHGHRGPPCAYACGPCGCGGQVAMNGGVFADGGGGVGPIPDGGYYGYGGGYMYGDGRSSAFVRSPARIGAPVPPAFRPGFRGGGMTGPRVVHH